jgi:hypothetical protein
LSNYKLGNAEREAAGRRMKRTIGIWIIAIFCALNAIQTVFGLYLLLVGRVPSASPSIDHFFATLGTADYALSLGFHLCIVIGGLLLFMMRKSALMFFIGAAVFKLGMDLWQYATHRFLAGAGGVTPLAITELAITWAIFIVIIAYVARLSKLGTLR